MRGKLRRYFGPIIGCEFSHGAAVTIANNVLTGEKFKIGTAIESISAANFSAMSRGSSGEFLSVTAKARLTSEAASSAMKPNISLAILRSPGDKG